MSAGCTAAPRDRRSTRRNSSHGDSSYAVGCLAKKRRPPAVRHDVHAPPPPRHRGHRLPPSRPYTTLFRSGYGGQEREKADGVPHLGHDLAGIRRGGQLRLGTGGGVFVNASHERRLYGGTERSEEHTSELQSRRQLVCRRLLGKKETPARRPPRRARPATAPPPRPPPATLPSLHDALPIWLRRPGTREGRRRAAPGPRLGGHPAWRAAAARHGMGGFRKRVA